MEPRMLSLEETEGMHFQSRRLSPVGSASKMAHYPLGVLEGVSFVLGTFVFPQTVFSETGLSSDTMDEAIPSWQAPAPLKCPVLRRE